MKDEIRLFGLLMLLFFCFGVSNGQTGIKTGKWRFAADNNGYESKATEVVIIVDESKLERLFSLLNDDSIPYTRVDKDFDCKIKTLNSEIDSLKLYYSELQNNEGKDESSPLWMEIMICAIALLLVLSMIHYFFHLKTLRDEVIDIVKDSGGKGRLKEWLDNTYEKKSPLIVQKSYEKEIRTLQDDNRGLKNRVAELEDEIRKLNKQLQVTNASPNAIQQTASDLIESPQLLYADSIIDGVFSHVREQENEDTVFVLKLTGEEKASITIFKRAYGKVLANASYLEGCDKQIIGNNSVEIIREGEAERTMNGKWKVVLPLKVEIR